MVQNAKFAIASKNGEDTQFRKTSLKKADLQQKQESKPDNK